MGLCRALSVPKFPGPQAVLVAVVQVAGVKVISLLPRGPGSVSVLCDLEPCRDGVISHVFFII